jgi:hypothetical protein
MPPLENDLNNLAEALEAGAFEALRLRALQEARQEVNQLAGENASMETLVYAIGTIAQELRESQNSPEVLTSNLQEVLGHLEEEVVDVTEDTDVTDVTEEIAVEPPQRERELKKLILKEDFATFIQQTKDSCLVSNILFMLHNYNIDVIDEEQFSANYVGISTTDSLKLSYMTSERLDSIKRRSPYVEETIWNPSMRFESSPGKVARKIFDSIDRDALLNHPLYSYAVDGFKRFTTSAAHGSMVTDDDVLKSLISNTLSFATFINDRGYSAFADAFRLNQAKDAGEFNLLIVKGKAIKYAYLESNYETLSGQLGSSCMRYERCQNYFDIYTKNPDVCELYALVNDSAKIQARALVWTVEGKKYHDRIYGLSELTMDKLRAHFLTNNIENCYSIRANLTIEAKSGETFDYQQYPYMDTFIALNEDMTKLTTNPENEFDGDDGYYLIRSTHGGRDFQSLSCTITCDDCGSEENEDDIHHIDVRGDRYNGYNLCSECSVYSEYYDQTISNYSAFQITYPNGRIDYILAGDTEETNTGRYVPSEDAVELVDGTYYWSDEVVQSIEGDWIVVNPNVRESAAFNNYRLVTFCKDNEYIGRGYTHEDNVITLNDVDYYFESVVTDEEGKQWFKPDYERHRSNLELI